MAKVRLMTERGGRFRSTPQRKAMMAAGLLLAVLGALCFSVSPSAQAATSASAITDYDVYPNIEGLIPDTCQADGAGVLQGISYAIDHDGTVTNTTALDTVQLFTGDTVTMSWTDYTAGCEGIGVSIAVKATDHPTFVLEDNQTLVNFAYCSEDDCGPGATGTSFGNLTVVIPEQQEACNFQLDAVIGPPLQNVGPLGSYYGEVNRQLFNSTYPDDPNQKASGPNMLIGFSNGGRGECIPPTADATLECASEGGPGADVAITNQDDDDVAVVDVYKDGTVVHSGVNVGVGLTEHVKVDFGPQETATVSVNDTSGGNVSPGNEIYSEEFTANCVDSDASISDNCVEGGTVISFVNNGDIEDEFVVTKDGTEIDRFTLPAGGSTSKTYAMDEDEVATFRVTATGYDSGDVEITHDCVEVEDSTTTSTPTTPTTPTTLPDDVEGLELARTGAGDSTTSMTGLAGLLLVAGGALMALANRPLPTGAQIRSRGR